MLRFNEVQLSKWV
jgi:hypothetical protein